MTRHSTFTFRDSSRQPERPPSCERRRPEPGRGLAFAVLTAAQPVQLVSASRPLETHLRPYAISHPAAALQQGGCVKRDLGWIKLWERNVEIRSLLVMAVFVTMTPLFATAQPDTAVEVKKGTDQATVSGTAKVKATVVGIDVATRTVTLKTNKGKVVELEVGTEARNFDQIKVGDIVNAEYKESLTLSLRKGGGKASVKQSETANRSAPGAKPGGTLGREVRVLANVVAINPQTKMVTVKGPQGNTVDLMVDSPDTLKNIKKGDQVEADYTEALAISVEPAGKQ